MKQYRFYLDNVLLEDDPKGWSEGKITFKRHEKLNALLYQYTSDLNFWGDGYSYLIGIANSGVCSEVNLRIEKSCDPIGNYTNIFEGLIKLRDAEVDERRCMIKCNAEDNSLSDRIVELSDAEFDISSSKIFIATAATPATQRVVALYNSIGVGFLTRNGYYVFDAFQFLFSALTNNNAVLTSNYFNTDSTTRLKFNIVFSNPTQLTLNGNNLHIEATNYFNQTTTFISAIGGLAATTLNNACAQLRPSVGGTVQNEYYTNDYSKVAIASNNGTNTISIENDLPYTINSIKINGVIPVTYTINTTSALADGMRKLVILTGGALRNAAGFKAPTLSLKKLFDELHKQVDLGMSIKNVNGVIQVRIEPIQFFFSQTAVLTLSNVPDMKYTISDRFTKDIVAVGDGRKNDSLRADLINVNDWYSGGNCVTHKEDLKNEFIVDWNEIDLQRGTSNNKFDDYIYLIECKDTTVPGADAENVIYQDKPINALNTGNVMNAHLTNYWKLRRWLFSMTDDPQFAGKRITNDALSVKKSYKFTYPLSFTDFQALRASDTQHIIFRKSDNPIDNKYGWIEEISYDIKNYKAEFSLIAT